MYCCYFSGIFLVHDTYFRQYYSHKLIKTYTLRLLYRLFQKNASYILAYISGAKLWPNVFKNALFLIHKVLKAQKIKWKPSILKNSKVLFYFFCTFNILYIKYRQHVCILTVLHQKCALQSMTCIFEKPCIFWSAIKKFKMQLRQCLAGKHLSEFDRSANLVRHLFGNSNCYCVTHIHILLNIFHGNQAWRTQIHQTFAGLPWQSVV